MNIDPRIIGTVLEVGRAVWALVSGSSEERKDAALAIAEAAVKAAVEEAKHQAAILGVAVAAIELDLAGQRLLAAMRNAEAHPKISIPGLLDIRVLGPDEHITDEVVVEVPEPKP